MENPDYDAAVDIEQVDFDKKKRPGTKINAIWEKVNALSRERVLEILGSMVHQGAGHSTENLKYTLVTAVAGGLIDETELE